MVYMCIEANPTFSSYNNSLLLSTIWTGDPASVLSVVNDVPDWIKQQLCLGTSGALNHSPIVKPLCHSYIQIRRAGKSGCSTNNQNIWHCNLQT